MLPPCATCILSCDSLTLQAATAQHGAAPEQPPGLAVEDGSEFTDSDDDDDGWQRPRGAASDSEAEGEGAGEVPPHAETAEAEESRDAATGGWSRCRSDCTCSCPGTASPKGAVQLVSSSAGQQVCASTFVKACKQYFVKC